MVSRHLDPFTASTGRMKSVVCPFNLNQFHTIVIAPVKGPEEEGWRCCSCGGVKRTSMHPSMLSDKCTKVYNPQTTNCVYGVRWCIFMGCAIDCRD